MDQVILEEEVGCFVPGRELVLSMLRWICETFAFETVGFYTSFAAHDLEHES